MFILKFIGFLLIISVVLFAVFLLQAVSKMEAEIKSEQSSVGEE
jgi:hypothetical protein